MAQSIVSFPSEYIDFIIDTNFFAINGIYTFRNNTGNKINQKIIFPFAVKSDIVDSIRVFDLRKLSEIKYIKMENGISFNIPLIPFDTTEINIFYRQPISNINC